MVIPSSSTRNMEKIWCWNDENNHKTNLDVIDSKEGKVTVEVDYRGGFPWILNGATNDLEALTQRGRDHTQCNGKTMNYLNWLKGVKWLMKLDRLKDKFNTQLFDIENENRCHVQGWTMSFHKYKWKMSPIPLISPSWRMSTFFIFNELEKGNKRSTYLIKWWVHSHMFYEPEEGRVNSHKGSFII